jgi:hypothetical protein
MDVFRNKFCNNGFLLVNRISQMSTLVFGVIVACNLSVARLRYVAFQAADLIAAVPEWTDKLIELQLWTRVAQQALTAGEHKCVERCANSALQYATQYTNKKW